MIAPSDPRHGSVAGYSAHYTEGSPPCRPCKDAKNEHAAWVRRQKAYGRYDTGMTDAEPVREHLRRLMAGGTSIDRIASQSGVPSSRITFTLYGRTKQPMPKRIKRVTADALLAVRPAPWKVDATGARRRLQALVKLGYNQRLLAREIGTSPYSLRGILHGRPENQRVTAATHATIDAAYQRLSMRLPPERTKAERHGATKARRLAERRGWLPPLAWDDIDDPDERPTLGDNRPAKSDVDEAVVLRVMAGERLPMTTGERVEVVARLRARGWSLNEIETRCHIGKPERYLDRGAA